MTLRNVLQVLITCCCILVFTRIDEIKPDWLAGLLAVLAGGFLGFTAVRAGDR